MQDHEFGQGVSFAEWSRGVVADREKWEKEHPEEAAAEAAEMERWVAEADAAEDAESELFFGGETPERLPLPPVVAAEVVARRLHRARIRVAKQEAYHRMLIERDNAWLVTTTAKDRDLIALCESQLTEFATTYLERYPKAPKTIPLPSAEIKTHAGSTVVEVTDEAGALAWAKEKDLPIVRTTDPKPAEDHIDKAAVKKLAGARLVEKEGRLYLDGDVAQGLVIEHKPMTVTIDTGGIEQ